MKKLFLLLMVIAISVIAAGQTAAVTLQATDTDGQPWATGTWSAALYSPPGVPAGKYVILGGSTNVPNQIQTGSFNSTGGATLTVVKNSSIAPSGTQWMFTFCPGTQPAPCTQTPVSITGPQTVAPTMPALRLSVANPLIRVTAYLDIEINGAQVGSIYFNSTDQTIHVCTTANNAGCITWTAMVSGVTIAGLTSAKVSTFCLSAFTCNNPLLTSQDESGAIIAAMVFSGCSRNGGCYIIDDMCDIQYWTQQPFATAAPSKTLNGIFQNQSNCPAAQPHVILVDGTSTILMPNGLWWVGQGTAEGELTPQYGSPNGNQVQGTAVRACNASIYPCPNGGFVQQFGTITSITAGTTANLATITVSGKPFTFNGSAINNLQQYRIMQLAGVVGTASAAVPDNAAWVVSDCNSGGCNSNPQSFEIAVPTTFVPCSVNCGVAFLDTAIISIGAGSGSGVFGTQIQNLMVSCSFLPGTIGIVNAIGQELSGFKDTTAWDCPVAGFRVDQSVAYNGAPFASSNSGPYGPASSNMLSVTCGNTTCACMGGSTSCSSVTLGVPGTVPQGTSMSCGASGSTATIWDTLGGISFDPCVNANHHSFLFTGASGQQGFGPTSHLTATINDKSAGGGTAVPQLQGPTSGTHVYGSGGIAGATNSCGIGVYGIHGEVFDYHYEYHLFGVCIGGDDAHQSTFYRAYTNPSTPAGKVITSGFFINGGFGGATGSGAAAVDIGTGPQDAGTIGDVGVKHWNVQNGGGATVVLNNITGEQCGSFGSAPGGDFVIDYDFGHSNTQTNPGQVGFNLPREMTTCSNLAHFTGNAFAVPLLTTVGITNYGVPVKADTGNANQFVQTVTTDTAAGIVIGVSYHSISLGSNATAYGQIVLVGIVPMLFGTSGTGNCAIGNFVIVDTTSNGHVKCTGTYSAGTVIGKAMQAMTATGGQFNVLVGLR